MNTTSLSLNHSLSQPFANWPGSLVRKTALLGASLISIIEAVSRVGLSCLAFTGYLVSFGYWHTARNWAIAQMGKGDRLTFLSLIYFRAVIFPISSPSSFAQITEVATVPPVSSTKQGQPLNAEMRLNQVRHGKELIARKLQTELQYAQQQAEDEANQSFVYKTKPVNFALQATHQIVDGHEVGICHFIGRRSEMEDEHLATSFELMIDHKVYPVQLFGVFDGHGGKQASQYIKENLQDKLLETLVRFCVNGLTDEAIWNALKITFAELHQEFIEIESGTTATVAMILDGKLWTANVGDSRTILDNGIQLSEDAKPADPRYKKGIENRGGIVFEGRVQGVPGDRFTKLLAVARAVGDHDVVGINPRPKITVYPLSNIPEKSHLILACDGIYEVASTRQIAAAVQSHQNQSAAELAENIVYSAYDAISKDNLSALVVKL